jgi:hypothetical protein
MGIKAVFCLEKVGSNLKVRENCHISDNATSSKNPIRKLETIEVTPFEFLVLSKSSFLTLWVLIFCLFVDVYQSESVSKRENADK